jgi:site-specific DNA-cytosine methylase
MKPENMAKNPRGMNVLSLFDGIACGRVALERAGIKVNKYYASEILKTASEVATKNYPDIIHLGDVTDWEKWNLEDIDLIIGGSPCQGFSFAGRELNFTDPRSKLFFVFASIVKHYKPKFFLLENVVMQQKFQDVITTFMGVEPILINSNLVSAHTRKRLYWTNIPVMQPADRGIELKDILIEKASEAKPARITGRRLNAQGKRDDYNKSIPIIQYLEVSDNKKAHCITTVEKDSVIAYAKTGKHPKAYDEPSKNLWRSLTPIEVERLQTLPDDYTEGVPRTSRLKMLGSGWTVEVIKHILSGLP